MRSFNSLEAGDFDDRLCRVIVHDPLTTISNEERFRSTMKSRRNVSLVLHWQLSGRKNMWSYSGVLPVAKGLIDKKQVKFKNSSKIFCRKHEDESLAYFSIYFNVLDNLLYSDYANIVRR